MSDYNDDPQRPAPLPNQAVSDTRASGREAVERAILLDQGSFVDIEGTWKTCRDLVTKKEILDADGKPVWRDESKVFVPRWSLRQMMLCSDRIATIITTLFPGDLFFLFNVEMEEIATAAARVNEILFHRVGPQVFDINAMTCGVESDEERALFERKLTPRDHLEIFVKIVEHEINNDNMQAITKKVKRLLGEKFSLENVFPSISDFMAEQSVGFLTGLQQISSTSSPNTPQSPPDEMN